MSKPDWIGWIKAGGLFDGIVARLPESTFMALRILNENLFQKTELSASVCIVGAGIAGLVAATRLARTRTGVLSSWKAALATSSHV